MNFPYRHSENSYPRPQAERIVRIITQEGFGFRGVLLGKWGEGKTDLLRQVQSRLFEKAEGPIPFFLSFPENREDAALAHYFFAAFCQQARAFLMRQEEMLWEPVAGLERELERAGLPLSLTELARQFLALTPAHQLEFAASLPAHFADRELRPLCLLFDDAQALHPASPFLRALDSPHLSWLLAGRQNHLARIAGAMAWPLVRLDSFSSENALAVAKQSCHAAGTEFFPEAWKQLLQIAGTSPWLISSLIAAAAIQQQPLDSVEQLARVYIRELASGTLGNWLARRFERAIPDRRQRAIAIEFLASVAKTGARSAAAESLPAEVWEGLISEEWAEESIEGPRILLDTLQRDWLSLVAARAGDPSERAEARLLLTALLRVEEEKEHPETARFSAVIHQRLLDLPQAGFPEFFTWEGQKIRLPKIFSVCTEAEATAELFWCYGFYEENQEFPKTPVVLLIAVCDESPTDGQLQKWHRQLESEARLVLPPKAPPSIFRHGLSPLQELWVAVPPGTSLAPTASERRFSWETFFRLAVQARTPDHEPPSVVGD